MATFLPHIRNDHSLIQQFPADILYKIFRDLDFVDQLRVARVCRSWNRAVKNFELGYGQMRAFFQLPHLEPRVISIQHSSQNLYISATCKDYILGYNLLKSFLLVNKENGSVQQLKAKDILSKEDLKNPVLVEQNPRAAVFLSNEEFITTMEKGTVAWWKITEKVARCVHHLQLFTPDELDAHNVYNGIALFNNLLYVGCHEHDRGYYLSKIVERTLIKDRIFADVEIAGNNADTLFDINQTTNTLSVFSTEIQLRWTYSIEQGSYLIQKLNRYIVIYRNQKSLVLPQVGCRLKTTLQILDPKDGHEIFTFQEDHGHSIASPRRSAGFELWNHGNFIFVIVGDKLHVWHILSRSLLIIVPLAKLFGSLGLNPDDLDLPEYMPIYHIEIFENELHLILKKNETNTFLVSKFVLNAPISQIIHYTPIRTIEKPSSVPKVNKFFTNFRSQDFF